jgi:hypothetical protein
VSFPSIYFGYNLVQNEQFIQKSNDYIHKISLYEGNFLLKSDINPKKKSINLIYGGTSLNDSQKEKITQMGRDYLPEDSEIIIEQGLSFDASIIEDDETKNLKAEINRLNQKIRLNENVIDSLTTRGVLGQSILREIQSIYPVIESCSYSKAPVFTENSDETEISNLVVFQLKKGQLNSKEKEKIRQWLSVKLSSENVQVFYVN